MLTTCADVTNDCSVLLLLNISCRSQVLLVISGPFLLMWQTHLHVEQFVFTVRHLSPHFSIIGILHVLSYVEQIVWVGFMLYIWEVLIQSQS